MARDPFAFLDSESPNRRVMLLLLALIRKQGGEARLSLEDISSVEDGSSFHKEPDDKGTSLVLRYARRGAEAYFLTATEEPSKTTTQRSAIRPLTPSESSDKPRHAIHDDMDLAMREEEMAQKAERIQQDRLRQARAEAGAVPWRTRPQ